MIGAAVGGYCADTTRTVCCGSATPEQQRIFDLVLRAHDGSTHAFTGDSLFPGGVGNTEHDAARFRQLLGDVEERIFGVLPDDTWVYPGHGKDTMLGAERPHLQEWHDRGW